MAAAWLPSSVLFKTSFRKQVFWQEHVSYGRFSVENVYLDPPTGGFLVVLGYLKASRNHLLGGTGSLQCKFRSEFQVHRLLKECEGLLAMTLAGSTANHPKSAKKEVINRCFKKDYPNILSFS